MKRTLALIALALALMVGSFIWFVATWDRDAEHPISHAPTSSDQEQFPPEGRSAANPNISVETQIHANTAVIFASTDPYQNHIDPIPNPYGVL